MSKRFAIRSTRPEEQKEGNKIIFGTGVQVPFFHTCTLFASQVDEGKVEYITGLEPRHIKYSKYFTEEEKKSLLVRQEEDLKILHEAYGKAKLQSDNQYFWGEASMFVINNETLDTFFDTEQPAHTLLYWKIMGGGYSDEIGPTFDIAQAFALPFYMTEIEEQAERETVDVSDKVEAYARLEELSKKKSNQDLLWIAWMILPPGQSGYTGATPTASLFKILYEFIEGKLVKKAKKACSKQFIEAAALLKGDRTRAIAKAIVKAGDHFGDVYTDKEGFLATRRTNLRLGHDENEAVETLLKPINQEELQALRDSIEDKLKK